MPTMMRVRLLFFAQYRDAAGTEALDLELPEGADVAALVSTVRAREGGFDSLPSDPAVAVNQEYAALDRALADGDEVAFLPPVAGG